MRAHCFQVADTRVAQSLQHSKEHAAPVTEADAALIIQRVFRGHQGRRLYVARLAEQFEAVRSPNCRSCLH
jgi:hypothetical protein